MSTDSSAIALAVHAKNLKIQRDELLAALRHCEAFIAKHADNFDLFHPETNTQKALSAARAAIAKAE